MTEDERIVRYSASELQHLRSLGTQTNWEAVEALTFDEIEASIDFEEEGYPDWTTAIAGIPLPKPPIS